MSEREMAERHQILRAVTGSTLHGLNVKDGIEDRDETGVTIENIEDHFAGFEQMIYRSAAEREHKHDARSMAGDLDLTIFSLRKFVRLALKGNPSILNLLFVKPGPHLVHADARGTALQSLAPEILSRQAGYAFLGYLIAQKQRLMGERGGKDVKRPELEKAYGFDTKYAMQAMRLGYQGIELMETGQLEFPMRDGIRAYLIGVRTGKESLQRCTTRIGELEAQLRDAVSTSPLPEEPDYQTVNAWMVRVYLENWKARDMSWKQPKNPLCTIDHTGPCNVACGY